MPKGGKGKKKALVPAVVKEATEAPKPEVYPSDPESASEKEPGREEFIEATNTLATRHRPSDTANTTAKATGGTTEARTEQGERKAKSIP